jgi:hypothetical protein
MQRDAPWYAWTEYDGEPIVAWMLLLTLEKRLPPGVFSVPLVGDTEADWPILRGTPESLFSIRSSHARTPSGVCLPTQHAMWIQPNGSHMGVQAALMDDILPAVCPHWEEWEKLTAGGSTPPLRIVGGVAESYESWVVPRTSLAKGEGKCRCGRFMGWIMVLRVNETDDGGAGEVHANAVLVDRGRREVVRYEPRGADAKYNQMEVEGWMKAFVQHYFPGYVYVGPLDAQLPKGPQRLEVEEAARTGIQKPHGMCVTWCALWMETRIKHADLDLHLVDRMMCAEHNKSAKVHAYNIAASRAMGWDPALATASSEPNVSRTRVPVPDYACTRKSERMVALHKLPSGERVPPTKTSSSMS